MRRCNSLPPTYEKDVLNNFHDSLDSSSLERSKSFFYKASKFMQDGSRQNDKSLLKHTASWGQSIAKDRFQDVDMLESGFARECITEECLSPTQNLHDWRNCYVIRNNKTEYKMYDDETNRFLLSAKQDHDTFYISLYENFPETTQLPATNYCAVLHRTDERKPNYKLFSCSCEGCDTMFSKYTCNEDNPSIQSDEETAKTILDNELQNATEVNEIDHLLLYHDHLSTAAADRQLLADITHSTKHIENIQVDMRNFNVVLPAIMEDHRSRIVWCPRINGSQTPRGSTPTYHEYPLVTASPLNQPKKENWNNIKTDRVRLESRLPEWNNELKSLVLKFHGGRVLAASSKNYLLVDAANKERAILQFGKTKKGHFVLDFRYPLAPIQAFGIALSACAWRVE